MIRSSFMSLGEMSASRAAAPVWLALVSVLGYACTSEPKINDPSKTPFAPGIFLVSSDNPPLTGFVPASQKNIYSQVCGGTCSAHGGCTGNKPCASYLQFEYANAGGYLQTFNPSNAGATSQQSYGGGFVSSLKSSVPVFNRGMKKLSMSPFSPPEGSQIETWVPDLATTGPAWIWTPNHCDNIEHDATRVLNGSAEDPACSHLRGRTMPFWASSLNMPRTGVVGFQLELWTGGPLTGAAFSPPRETRKKIQDGIAYIHNPNVPVLPVHVHVFVNSDGANDYTNFFRINSANNIPTVSAFTQAMFDARLVHGTTPGASVSATDWERFMTASLATTNIFGPPGKGLADNWFGRCGIGTRLESLNIVRQNELIDETLGDAYKCTENFCSSPGHYSLSVGKYIGAFFASLQGPGASLPQGAHVFVVGLLPGEGIENGCGCRSKNGGPGYAFISGFGTNDVRRTISHELSHVLGVRHVASSVPELEEIDLVEYSFVTNAPFPVTNEEQALCARMRANAFGPGFGVESTAP